MFASRCAGKVDSLPAGKRDNKRDKTCPRRQLHLDSWNGNILLCHNEFDGDRQVAANLHPILSVIRPCA
jgi:hypothetical protein